MSRNLLRAELAALLLVPLGCAGGDDAATTATRGTVAVGGVLDAFPTTVARSTTVAPTDPPTTRRTTTTSSTSSSTSTTTTLAPTTTTTPGPTQLAIELADIAAPDDDAPMVYERVDDDTGRLSMDVPVDWSERSTSTGRLADGSAAPYLAASPDMRAFLDGYESPGMTVVVLPGDEELQTAQDAYRFDEDCVAGGELPYDGVRMSGEFRVYRDCGGTDTDILTVVGEPAGDVGTVLLLAQIREQRDLVAVDAALASMVVRRR